MAVKTSFWSFGKVQTTNSNSK